MGFREDREAIARRADSLERDLVDAKHKLDAESLRAVEVDDLRKRVDALTTERDALQRGVEPIWRRRTMLAAMLVVLVVSGGGLFVAWTHAEARRTAAGDARELQRLMAELASVEPRISAATDARDRALAEVDRANQSGVDEARRLERLVQEARVHQTGEVFLVTASVAATSGPAPATTGARCAMTLRRFEGECVASILCDGAVVFPIVEPMPSVHCTGEEHQTWTGGAVVRVNAGIPGIPSLLDYERARGRIIVRETAVPWTMTLDVRDAMPLLVR